MKELGISKRCALRVKRCIYEAMGATKKSDLYGNFDVMVDAVLAKQV